MARPRGEIREAMNEALKRLCGGGAGATVREVAAASNVAYRAAKKTMENMVCAQEVEKVGKQKLANSAHWEHVYALTELGEQEVGMKALAGVMAGFAACPEGVADGTH